MPESPVSSEALRLIRERLQQGEVDSAIALMRSAVDQPDCAEQYLDWILAERRLEHLSQLLPHWFAAGGDLAALARAVDAGLRGQTTAALPVLQSLLQQRPDWLLAQHLLARTEHNLGQSEAALQRLSTVLQQRPDYPEAWYSRAHIERAIARLPAAEASYRRALSLWPCFDAAALNLGITLSALDRPGDAADCLQALLARDPQSIEARLNLGLCRHVLGQHEASAACYRAVLQQAPEHPLAHYYLGCLLNEQMQSANAKAHLQRALHAMPEDVDVLTELAGVLEQDNDLEAAAGIVQRGLALAPQHPGLLLEAARLRRRAGAVDEAKAMLDAIDAARLPTRQAQAYWFERGLVLDRCRSYPEAMAAFERGNALAAANPRRASIDREAFARRCDAIAAWLESGAPGAQTAVSPEPTELPFRPAFLVGFPRSGTTLLDTMLDVHPAVVSIEEKATLELAIDEVLEPRGGYPAAMPTLDAATAAALRERYRQAVQAHIGARQPELVLDKLPLRMLRVPLIRRLFPQAPIVFAVRHPCDVVLSNLMQQYAPNEAFVHFDTVLDAARMYDRVMRLWRRILRDFDLQPHWVRYEALVADPESELRAACAALELDLRPAMLDPASRLQDRGRVQTNSYQQVAEPIYRRAAGRWRQYQSWLVPARSYLQPHLDWLGYSDDGFD